MHATGAIDRSFVANLLRREDYVRAYGTAYREERLDLFFRNLADDPGHRPHVSVGVADGVTREVKFASLRYVMKISRRARVREDECAAVWQRLAPEQLVVAAECWTVTVGISAVRCVGVNIELRVDHDSRLWHTCEKRSIWAEG